MAEVITYETLYELLRKEKYNPDIQEIDKDFFKKVISYLEEKERLAAQSSRESAFSKEIGIAKKQIENARKLIKDLYERRENKIVQSALLSSRSNSKENLPLLQEEQKLYSDINLTLTRYRKEILENILQSKPPSINEDAPKSIKTDKGESPNKLIRFLHSTPKFVAPDLKVYGPFEREEISNVPKKIASVLIKKKRAEEIKIEKK